MNRGIITISETGVVIVPTAPIWMTKFEIADMFGVFSYDIRKAIRAIYKNKELNEAETMRYIRQPEGGNLAASKIRNLECPSYEICLIDYGCGKFNRKIHIMEQYP